MSTKKIGLTAAAVVASAGLLVAGGNALAQADESSSTSSSGSTTGQAPGGASQDTAVTGSDASKVIDAVEAAYPSAAIDSVRQDPDGSYDALGTKDGQPVMYDVSEDLATITEAAGGPGGSGGPGGMAPHEHTPVTGAERAKVVKAVKAEDDTITVTSVEADPDGSYDVHGTKDGQPTMVNVSKDLSTVEVGPGAPN